MRIMSSLVGNVNIYQKERKICQHSLLNGLSLFLLAISLLSVKCAILIFGLSSRTLGLLLIFAYFLQLLNVKSGLTLIYSMVYELLISVLLISNLSLCVLLGIKRSFNMTFEEFCDTVILSLNSSIVNTQNAKKAYESEFSTAFIDNRISQFQDALRYVKNIRRLEHG